jgi:LacI family transcriptional regulator
MADKLTIVDIARLAGVSKATVSRVINQKPDVDPETRERVLRIMAKAGFVPSITATGLAGRSRLIGVLVPSLTWPFIGEIMRGVAEKMESSAYELVLYCITHANQRSRVFERILETRLTSGLLAILPGELTDHLNALYEQGFPVVVIDDQGHPTNAPWIGADNQQGAYMATRHLLHLGHRRIGFISGPERYQCAIERRAGYDQALREAGQEPDPELILQGDFETPSGRVCGERFLGMADRPTAIFASNDHMAYGVIDYAEARGTHVPTDLAVVGYDDIPLSVQWRPSLTTVRQPFFEMGQRGFDQLLQLIEDTGQRQRRSATPILPATTPSATETLQRVWLPTQLMIRESCGAALAKPVAARDR